MRFRTPPVGRDVRDETIRRLESDLYMARLDIVRLAPEQFQSLLESFYSCASRTDAYQWQREVADKVADAAIPISEGMRPDLFGERAYCLCVEARRRITTRTSGDSASLRACAGTSSDSATRTSVRS